jgi:twinkle protein
MSADPLDDPRVVRLADRARREAESSVGVNFRAPSSFAGATIAEIRSPTEATGATLPWVKTHNRFRLRPGEVTMWAGANGSWKTMVMSQIAIDLSMRQGEHVVMASLEMPPAKQLKRIAIQGCADGSPSDDAARAMLEDLGENFTLVHCDGVMGPDVAIRHMEHAAEALRAQHFILDNLSCVIPLGKDSDRIAQRFIVEAAELARSTGLHIHIVGHIRKPADDRPPDRYEIRGTGSIPDLVDNVAMFWRNRKKERAQDAGEAYEPEDPDLRIMVDKQRHGAWEGFLNLWITRRCLRFVADAHEEILPYCRLPAVDQLAGDKQT